jgi:hypothetical protein
MNESNQETTTKIDAQVKMKSKQAYHQNHTFEGLGKPPSENVGYTFVLLKVEELMSAVRRFLCAATWPFAADGFGRSATAALFPDYDFRLRGTFLATPFGLLSYVTVQKAAANQQKQTK